MIKKWNSFEEGILKSVTLWSKIEPRNPVPKLIGSKGLKILCYEWKNRREKTSAHKVVRQARINICGKMSEDREKDVDKEKTVIHR